MHEKIHKMFLPDAAVQRYFQGQNRGFRESEEELLNEYCLFMLETPDALYSIPLVGHNSDLLYPVGFLWKIFLCAG